MISILPNESNDSLDHKLELSTPGSCNFFRVDSPARLCLSDVKGKFKELDSFNLTGKHRCQPVTVL